MEINNSPNPVEVEPKQTPDEYFDGLGIDVCAKIPISMINPSDADNGKSSHSKGPIKVYRSKGGKIVILDGNHRYYEQLNEIRSRPGFKKSDFDTEMAIIKKVEKDVEW